MKKIVLRKCEKGWADEFGNMWMCVDTNRRTNTEKRSRTGLWTEEEEEEYYKLKNHITDNKPLYYIVDECSWEDGTYTLWVEESGHSYHLDKNGYQLDYTLALNSEEDERIFNSQEEAEKFKYENVLSSDHPTPDDLQRNITFDDEALTINWQYKTNYLNSANDILPAFLLVAYIVSIVIIIISLVIYFRKKKKIG